MTKLPIVGAALTLREFETFRDFMSEMDRPLEVQDFHRPELLIKGFDERIKEGRTILKGYRGPIGIHGPFWDFNIASWDPQFRTLAQSHMSRAIEACAAIGGSHMVVHSPFTIWDHFNVHNYPNARHDQMARAQETLSPIIGLAEREGITLMLENCEDVDPLARVELAQSMESKNVAVSVDTGHAHFAHGALQAPPVDYYVAAAGKRLKHVHLQDADAYADRHWQIGLGTINWDAVLAAVSKGGSEPRLILELRDKSGILPSWRFLREKNLVQ